MGTACSVILVARMKFTTGKLYILRQLQSIGVPDYQGGTQAHQLHA